MYVPADVDECSMNLDDCHTNANCIDMEDGFICNCGTGYTGNGTDCTSVLRIIITLYTYTYVEVYYPLLYEAYLKVIVYASIVIHLICIFFCFRS